MRTVRFIAFLAAVALVGTSSVSAQGPSSWSTYRGNPQRTASDGKPGPNKPAIVWVLQSKEHYVASPVPAGDRLFVSGLGAFNVSLFHCLTLDPKVPADKRALWSKTTPALKLPTVSAPAIADGRVIFGDGMHQTDGAVLHCLGFDKGLRLWQLRTPPPDKLVHLEATPTISGNRAFIGGGAAGVLAVDIAKVTLDGKPMDPKDIQKAIEDRWVVLQKQFEADKKKDPDFAIPPTEDDLPKAAPTLLWKQGQGKWHVDAPVNVIGEDVLVGSSFLDKEMEGDRALYNLEAGTGKIKWRTPLTLNPWGGAAVQDKLVVVTGSSIGYYPGQIKGAKGEIAAYELGTGKEMWKKEVQGGVPSCAVLADGNAYCTATDGKVRAFSLVDGARSWIFDAKTPFFAPPAVSDGVVYAGDLNGVIYALNAKDGSVKWTLDLGSDPTVKAPGAVYGGPIVHGGKVYVATCNVEGVHAGKPTVVVCIGDK